MNVSLTPVLEKLVQDKVESGLYTSASEVIREALRLMIEHDRLERAKLTALREEIDLGIAQLAADQYTEYTVKSSPDLLNEIKKKRK